jgi:hypothetical protein
MKIFNAVDNADIINTFYDKTQLKLNVLASYPYLKGNGYKLAKQYREMIDSLYLDSGAYSASKGKFRLTVSEYKRFIIRCGSLFDAVFSLDDDFGNPDHNFNNQAYLEEGLPEDCKKPVPVIHDEANPLEEFETYVKQGHGYIAIGSNQRVSDEVLSKIKDKYPDVKIHMFGTLNRKLLMNHMPYSADATTWAKAAGFGKIYYWDSIDEKEYLIYLGGKEVKDGKIIKYDNFHHKTELVAFLADTFGYDRNDLMTSAEARRIVNLYFFKQLEDHIKNDGK